MQQADLKTRGRRNEGPAYEHLFLRTTGSTPQSLSPPSLQVPASRTPVAGKPPNPRLQGCNKENEAQLRGSPVGGLTPLTPLTHCSMASVASTYSEFVVTSKLLNV